MINTAKMGFDLYPDPARLGVERKDGMFNVTVFQSYTCLRCVVTVQMRADFVIERNDTEEDVERKIEVAKSAIREGLACRKV